MSWLVSCGSTRVGRGRGEWARRSRRRGFGSGDLFDRERLEGLRDPGVVGQGPGPRAVDDSGGDAADPDRGVGQVDDGCWSGEGGERRRGRRR